MTPVEPPFGESSRSVREPGADRLLALQELAQALASAPTVTELCEQALGILQSTLELSGVAILALDPAGGMRCRCELGLSAIFAEKDQGYCPWPVDAPNPQPVIAQDIERDAVDVPGQGALLAEGFRSLVFVPIQNQGRLFGEFLLCAHGQGRFTPDDVRFAVTVSNLAGYVLARSRQDQAMADTVAFSERLIESANVLVVGLDRMGRVAIFNETAERISGYKKEELLGRSWFETVVPRDRFPSVWDYFDRLLGPEDLPREAETPLLSKSGEERLVAWRNSVFGEPGAKVATLSFGIDVTEARRGTEALRASEAMFSRIFHLSPDAIDLTRTEDGVTLDCNHNYLKLTGYSREEVIGHSTLPGDLGVWVHKEDRDRHVAALRERGEIFGLEVPLRRKDGSEYLGLISSSMLEIDGQPCNLTLTRDITERKKAEEALRISEEKFSKTFRLSPDSININRLRDGVYLDINQGFTEIMGYTAEDTIGRSALPGDLNIWVRKEDRERLVLALETRGEMTGLEAQFRRKDGSTLIGMMSARVIELWGEPCILSITRDITERKRAEEALRESTQRLQLALASGNLGIWDWDLRQGTEIWDDRMYGLYGLGKTAVLPNYETWIEKIVHPDDAPMLHEAIRAALAGEQPYDVKFRIVRPDGSVRYIQSNGIVIRDDEGKAIQVIGINRDRTEQVEAEAERRRLQTEVHHAEKLESIGSLAGGMAHDMNNILTGILITAEMLHGKCAADDPMAKSLAVILHAGQRGRDLVKALTDFARKGLADASAVDLNEVLRREVELLRHTTLKKIQVVLDLDDNLPVILGAASELGSAIMNLSVNAVDAMPEGGTLTFRSRALPGGLIVLTVADTGHGMTPEVKAKAMEPFFTTKPVGKGTGLGLARVYGTMRAHGGTVELQSRPGEGTTVVLRLPSGPGSSPDIARTGDPVPRPQDPPRRILLVDDEGIILDSIPTMLESIGHIVETASLGEEALRRLELRPDFDLVILDHNMPGLTGAETLVQLRAKYPELPVILSTGFMDLNTEALLTDIPKVWILKKPYQIQEIQQTLAEITRIDLP